MLTDIKGKININTKMLLHFTTSYTLTNLPSRKKKKNKEAQALNATVPLMNFIVIYITFHMNIAEYTSKKNMKYSPG